MPRLSSGRAMTAGPSVRLGRAMKARPSVLSTLRVGRLAIGVAFVVSLLAAAPLAQTLRPSRIISLVPALTEMLFAIGAGPQVVAVSSYDEEPAAVRRLPRVGALLDPDVERILSLKPDLVVTYGSQADLQQQLRRAAIPVFDYRHGGLATITETMRALGARTGHPAEAERAAAGIEAGLADIRRRTGSRPAPRTLLVFGRESGALRNIWASGGRGFLHDMLVAAGGTNVMGDIDRESVQTTTEMVLTRRPDVIVELRSNAVTGSDADDDAAAAWARLAAVPAVRDRRVHVLTGRGLVVPGPRVAESTRSLAAALHPEAFAR
jgi:iron complex transport system substrate-binding protein